MGIFFSNNYADVMLDFEDATPTPSEASMHAEWEEILEEGEALIMTITEYKGCKDLQRAAMMNRSPDAESICFNALLQSVSTINDFYLFSKKLETKFPDLMLEVCSIDADHKDALQNKQALATQVAKVLDFALRFDQKRMACADVSNDFSYYRRLLPKFQGNENIIVGDDEAATMAMFTAEYQPMMVSITTAGVQAQNTHGGDHVIYGLALLANSCKTMIENKSFNSDATNLFAARAMTGGIVLYDRIDSKNQGNGVFHKKSPVAIKACINCLKKCFPSEGSLLNIIRYSTLTFNDASSSIEALFP